MSKKPSKNTAHSQAKDTPESRAAQIVAMVGGGDGLTVAVFRRTTKGDKVHVGGYPADDFSPERVLDDHGPGHYTMQVRDENRIVKTKNFSVGDVAELSPTSAAASPGTRASGEKNDFSNSSLMQLLIAQQQSMTQIVCAMIASSAGGGSMSSLLAPLVQAVASRQDAAGGIAEAMKAIETARSLLPDSGGGGSGRADREANAAQVVTAIANAFGTTVPAIIDAFKSKGGQMATSQHEPISQRGGVSITAEPRAQPAAIAPASSPAQGASTPAPPAVRRKLPFPGADQIAAGLLKLAQLLPDGPVTPDGLSPDVIDQLAQGALDEIDNAGGKPVDAMDDYPEPGGLAAVLIRYEPQLERARMLLVAVDARMRVLVKWEPDDGGDETDDDESALSAVVSG